MASEAHEYTTDDSTALPSSGHEVHFATDSWHGDRETVYHHVEDISDATHYPPWSTGVSRMHSRAQTPANSFLGHHEGELHANWMGSHTDGSDFNPARIPLNLSVGEPEQGTTHQVPLTEILKHIDEDIIAEQRESLVQSDPAEAYEHQNAAENNLQDFEETAPVISTNQTLDELGDRSGVAIQDSIVIHDLDQDFAAAASPVQPSPSAHDFSGPLLEDETDFDTMLQPLVKDRDEAQVSTLAQGPEGTFSEQDGRQQLAVGSQTEDAFGFLASSQGDDANDVGGNDRFATATVVDTALEIPDDLDEADYDLEEDLDAEFAAMEASFQQTMIKEDTPVRNMTGEPEPAPSATMDIRTSPMAKPKVPRKTSNPYAPKVMPTPQSDQMSSTLFTPASMLQSPGVAASQPVYNPLPQSSAFRPPQPLASDRARPSSAASFVSGKAAYTDPYALPETLVAKARPRPQAQSLRNVASVPNFKARDGDRPPISQRHVSSTGVQQSRMAQVQQVQSRGVPYHSPSAAPTQPMQTGPSRPSDAASQVRTPSARYMPQNNTSYGSGIDPRIQRSSFPNQPSLPTMQVQPGQAYPQHSSQPHGSIPTTYRPNPSTTNIASKSSVAYYEEPRGPGTQYVKHGALPQQLDSRVLPLRNPTNQNPQPAIGNNYGNAQAYTISPPPMQRRPSPYDPQRSQSIDNVMRGINIPPNNGSLGRVTSPLSHDRHASSMSTTSEGSEAPRQEAIGDFLNQQRGAETRMFDDGYAIAHDDLREAETIQRANSAFLSDNRVPSRFSEIVGDRTSLQTPVNFPDTSTQSLDGYSPRRSLDDPQPTANFAVNRPPPRNATNQYAHTEPSSSPRQAHNVPSEYRPGSSQTTAMRRPPIISRATSSAQHLPQPQKSLVPQLQYQASSHTSSTSREPGQTDPLVGHPIASFGFGGKLVTSIPKTVPRFSHGNIMMTQIAGPGPVTIRALKEVVLDDIFADFPGPLTHSRAAVKQKKGDLQLWLAKRVPPSDPATQDDRIVLYRLLMLLLECNGALDSAEKNDKLVKLLCPELHSGPSEDDSSNFSIPANLVAPEQAADSGPILSTTTLTESSTHRLAELILRGNKDGALRFASDKGLWAHALVIASRSGSEAWASVLQEFANAEFRSNSDAAQNLKFLYQSFAGSSDTRSRIISNGYSVKNWRKSLTMLLNNRIAQEDSAIISLGQSLLANGQIYAAHFCLLLCTKPAIGPVDDGKAIFSLVGLQNSVIGGWTLEKNEAVVMSEIYEFALSLAQPKAPGLPHLLAFKLQRAHLLTDAGHVAAAKRYCEGITMALKVLPKSTAHLHHVLIEQLRDLSHRIDQNPGEEAPSWLGSKIARPKMDNIWGSLEGKFSKFVSGDAEESDQKTDANTQGPFGKLAQTPALSRVQSVVDVRARQPSVQGYTVGGYGPESLQPNQAASKPDHGSYPYAAPTSIGVFSTTSDSHDNQAPFVSSNYTYTQTPQDVVQRSQNRYQPASGSTQYPAAQMIDHERDGIDQGTGLESSPFARNDYGASMSNRYTPIVQPATQQFSEINDGIENGEAASGKYMASQAQPYVPFADENANRQTGLNYGDNNVSYTQGTSQFQPPQHVEPSKPIQTEVSKSEETVDAPERAETSGQASTKDEKSSESEAGEKKSGWLGGWFGGKKKEATPSKDADVKVHKAKLGEGMSLVYDPVTKKWTNPKGTMPEESKASAPPPPMSKKGPAPPTSASPTTAQGSFNSSPMSTTPQPGGSTPNSMAPPATGIPPMKGPVPPRKLANAEDDLAAMLGAGPAPRRAASGAGPPQAGPGANAGGTMPRAKKGKPAKRYVDVFSEG